LVYMNDRCMEFMQNWMAFVDKLMYFVLGFLLYGVGPPASFDSKVWNSLWVLTHFVLEKLISFFASQHSQTFDTGLQLCRKD
jgi:hypothetical protein